MSNLDVSRVLLPGILKTNHNTEIIKKKKEKHVTWGKETFHEIPSILQLVEDDKYVTWCGYNVFSKSIMLDFWQYFF